MEGSPKKNHHLRNIEHLKLLKAKNVQKLNRVKAEKERMQRIKQNLANAILKNAERKMTEESKQPPQKKPETSHRRVVSEELKQELPSSAKLLRHTFSCISENYKKPSEPKTPKKVIENHKKNVQEFRSPKGIDQKRLEKPANPFNSVQEHKSPKRVDQKRLERLANPTSKPPITDMAQFKKKHNLDKKTKIFIVKGGYPRIVKSLISRSIF